MRRHYATTKQQTNDFPITIKKKNQKTRESMTRFIIESFVFFFLSTMKIKLLEDMTTTTTTTTTTISTTNKFEIIDKKKKKPWSQNFQILTLAKIFLSFVRQQTTTTENFTRWREINNNNNKHCKIWRSFLPDIGFGLSSMYRNQFCQVFRHPKGERELSLRVLTRLRGCHHPRLPDNWTGIKTSNVG